MDKSIRRPAHSGLIRSPHVLRRTSGTGAPEKSEPGGTTRWRSRNDADSRRSPATKRPTVRRDMEKSTAENRGARKYCESRLAKSVVWRRKERRTATRRRRRGRRLNVRLLGIEIELRRAPSP